jgi:protein-disulfide isomerase
MSWFGREWKVPRFGKMTDIAVVAGLIAAGVIAVVLRLGQSVDLEFKDRSHPQGFRELVIDSGISRFDPITGFQRASATNLEGRTKRSRAAICDSLFRDPNAPAFGDPDGRLQLAAFFDYRCSYCRTLTTTLLALLQGNHRVVFKEWPVLGDGSELASRAALAAAVQGRYLAFHQRLMSTRFIPTVAFVEHLAVELGMDPIQLREDMNSKDVALVIEHSRALASELELIGTPAFVVDRTIVQGAITRSQFEALVRDATTRPKTC